LITIASVLYRNGGLLKLNQRLTQALNTGTAYRWIVADNELKDKTVNSEFPLTIEGVAKTETSDMGSLHHAKALQKCLERVDSRFVLTMDPDFFVVQQDWLRRVVAYVTKHDISFFGSCWHPRWYYQYRYFPTIHFMLIDLAKVPAGSINFLPLIEGDRFWHFVNNDASRVPEWIRRTLKMGRIRDTGWQIYCRYSGNPSFRAETLVPSFRPRKSRRASLEKKLAFLLPERFRYVPRRAGAFTTDSFLEKAYPRARRRGWEEFYWGGEPFAFHLRSVGRRVGPRSEVALAGEALKGLVPGFQP